MPDREKVVKGLKHCKSTWMCNGCPYEDDSTDDCKMYEDALALLREQEPVKPKKEDAWPNMITVCGACGAVCGACGPQIPTPGEWRYNYCPTCGRKVKWND